MDEQPADRIARLRQERAERAFKRQEDGDLARLEYEGNAQGIREKTARLKAQRLAKEDQEREAFTEKTQRAIGKAKAAQMASRQIDRLSNPAATQEQLASRKRKLIKGPKEFRNLRTDLPTSEVGAADSLNHKP
jgi:hypothetical protein